MTETGGSVEARLERASGDGAALADLVVESSVADAATVTWLRTVVEVACVPHWFDEDSLLHLLSGIPSELSPPAGFIEQLRALPFVESFPARGDSKFNIHESTRLPMRDRMAREDPNRLRALSNLTADRLSDSAPISERIERSYHLLVADEAQGWRALEDLGLELLSLDVGPRHALDLVLQELLDSATIFGRSRLWAELVHLEYAIETEGPSSVVEDAFELLGRSFAADEDLLVGNTCWVLARALRSRGDLTGAMSAALKSRSAYEALQSTQTNPRPLLRHLATLSIGVGDLALQLGELRLADEALTRSLELCSQWIESGLHVSYARRSAAVALSRLGDAALAVSDFELASSRYGEALETIRNLATEAPSSSDRRRDLAVCLSINAHLMHTIGRFDPARESIRESIDIFEDLASTGLRTADLLTGLANAYSLLGHIAVTDDALSEASEAYGRDLDISLELLEIDRNNSVWRSGLAVTYVSLGHISLLRSDLDSAATAFDRAIHTFTALASIDQKDVDVRRNLALAMARRGEVAERSEELDAARVFYDDSLALLEPLVEARPDDAERVRDLALARYRLGALALTVEDRAAATDWLELARSSYLVLLAKGADNAKWSSELQRVEDALGMLNR